MSKKLELLHAVQEQRINRYPEAVASIPRTRLILVFGTALLVIIILNLVVAFTFFQKMKNYDSIIDSLFTKSVQAERLSSDAGSKISIFSSDLGRLNTELKATSGKFQDINTKVSQLSVNFEAQNTAIENLARAKDTLFKRVSFLEVELYKINEKRSP